MAKKIPRLVIAGLSGDSGKTIATLSLLTALRRRGLKVSAFKKGPDYIDPAWLSWAAGSVCRNLDTYLVNENEVLATFQVHAKEADISIIEGNRGIFDGIDENGKHSTAELAKLLRAPVVLVADCTKTTRTIAALIKGCIDFDPGVNIVGVILNNLAGKRHRKVVSKSIEKYCGIPVLGTISRLDDAGLIPGRHLGLVTPSEFESRSELEGRLPEIAENYMNPENIIEIANNAHKYESIKLKSRSQPAPHIKIGFFKDSVFTFYYPENLESLREQGAELIPISSLSNLKLPDIDGLYIGGGFPETHAEKLSENRALMESVKSVAEEGMPIYAECGGLIYLSRSLKWNDKIFEMAGLFDIDLEMSLKPQGHGYVEAEVDKDNPFFQTGSTVRGHEFHYSGLKSNSETYPSCFNIKKGKGIGTGRDGILYRNCFAAYTHIHAKGIPGWAVYFTKVAGTYSNSKKKIEAIENRNQYAGVSN